MFDIFGTKEPQKALQKAHEYIKEGRMDAAIKVLEGNLTQGEESFDLYLELARLYFEADERDRSAELIHKIQILFPTRTDEVVALASDLFYRHTSIDFGDLLLQLYVSRHQYEDLEKVLHSLGEREIKLLLTRYEKLRQLTTEKKVLTKKDFENILLLSAVYFFLKEGKAAAAVVEPIIDVVVFGPQLLIWAKIIAREHFNDPHAGLLLLKILIVNRKFDEVLVQAQRILEKFPDALDPLIEAIAPAQPPKELESSFAQLLTNLYVKKGDLDASIKRLTQLLKKDTSKVDEVIKMLRELERVSPKNLKVLYTLSDTYLDAHRTALAISELDKILELAPNQEAEVLSRYKQAFAQEPNNPLVIDGLVNFYLKQNDLAGAVSVIETAYRADPGLLDEYILNLNLILEKDIKNPRALYLLGLSYAHKGEKENSLVILETLLENEQNNYVELALKEILKSKPDDLSYLTLSARNLVMLGKPDEAQKLLIPHLGKNLDEILVILPALDSIINRKPELAKDIIPFYEKHRKKEPFIFELALARGYAFCGEYDKSVKNFEECFQNPEKKPAAKKALIEVIRERPKAVPLLLTAARIFMKEGEVEIATQFFKTAQVIDPKAFFEIVDEFYDTLKTFPKDRQVRVLLTDTFFNRKLYDRVIEEAKKGIEVFGHDAQYFNLRLGQALTEIGNLSDGVRPLMLALEGAEDYSKMVIKYLDKILEIDKSNVPAHFALGRALAKARRIDESVDEYLLTARILPARAEYVLEELKTLSARAIANPKIVFAMGSIEIILKKYDEGIKHLSQSCELDTTSVKQVIPLFEKLISDRPSPLLEFSLAKVYHLANLISSAVKFYTSAQAHNKEFREPVITELKKICAENPQDIEARKGLAQVHYGYGNLEDALNLAAEIYELDTKEADWIKSFILEIMEKNPRHTPSYYLLSYIFLKEENYQKALEVTKKLLEISPGETTGVIEKLAGYEKKSPEVLFYIGTLYKDIGDNQHSLESFGKLFLCAPAFNEAILQQLKEMLLKNSSLGEAYLLSSKILAQKEEHEKAIEVLKRAKDLIPEKRAEIILKEGELYSKLGNVTKAIETYNQLLAETKDRKAIYRLIKKTRDEYLKEKLETTRGEDDKDRLARANIYLSMNDYHNAGKELRFEPKNSQSAKQLTLLKARLCLKKNHPLDAYEIIKNLPVDAETASLYADIYEAVGSYEAAASVLKQVGVLGMEERIVYYKRLAQKWRLAKGNYFIEGRI